MTSAPPMAAIQSAITEAARLEKVLKDGRPRVQVTLTDERQSAKATALAWFGNHKQTILEAMSGAETAEIDDGYKKILEASKRAGARTTYFSILITIRRALIRLQSNFATLSTNPMLTGDVAPNFAPLASDAAMQAILLARWHECIRCIAADVPLAADAQGFH
jgi:hypothetical protein